MTSEAISNARDDAVTIAYARGLRDGEQKAQAMVAAERESIAKEAEATAKRCEEQTMRLGGVAGREDEWNQWFGRDMAASNMATRIRARATADERAALDALLRAERVKALREAQDIITESTRPEMAIELLHNLIEKETGHE